MSYFVIEESSADRLATRVNSFLRDGWEPVGGISVMFGSGWTLYVQAVFKRPIPTPSQEVSR